MVYDPSDTICAIASAAGGGARGIVRVSGPDALATVGRMFVAEDGVSLSQLRRASAIAGAVRLASDVPGDSDSLSVPCDVFLWPSSRSYTREPIAELHTFGSPPLLDAVVATICQSGGRLAAPGEFTLRAFLAGRLDLTQAEAVLGVIDARGNEELNAAIVQLAGGVARPLQAVREELLQLLTELEAGLDFVEEDIEFISAEELQTRLERVGELVADLAEQMSSRSLVGTIAEIVLVGQPNAGKSSLFNALVSRLRLRDLAADSHAREAIVSPQSGTTRDYLSAVVDIAGIRCTLVDTAGADDSVLVGGIEHAAQELSTERRAAATVRLHCCDIREQHVGLPLAATPRDILVLTKADLVTPGELHGGAFSGDSSVVITSARTGEGLERLASVIKRSLIHDAPHTMLPATASRCRESVRLAQTAIESAVQIAQTGGGQELVASELRSALAEIGKVVGAVYTDDILDRVFSTFCIGK